jgi:hypothetical protein
MRDMQRGGPHQVAFAIINEAMAVQIIPVVRDRLEDCGLFLAQHPLLRSGKVGDMMGCFLEYARRGARR